MNNVRVSMSCQHVYRVDKGFLTKASGNGDCGGKDNLGNGVNLALMTSLEVPHKVMVNGQWLAMMQRVG